MIFSARRYKPSKIVHNMFYSLLGVVQFTIWEAIFVHCYATNRLPFLTDQQEPYLLYLLVE